MPQAPLRKVARVSAQKLREIFNRGQYWERTQQGEFREVVISSAPASSKSGQRPGTKSEMIEYRSLTQRVALVHQFTRPDGSIGGSGRPDPKAVLDGETLYILESGRGWAESCLNFVNRGEGCLLAE